MSRPPLVVLASLLVLGEAGTLFAQGWQAGGKVGASVATLQRDVTRTGDDPFATRTGRTAGLFAVRPVRDPVFLQIELLFTEKGGSLPFRDPGIIQGSASTRYQFHYLDVPVLMRVRGPRVGRAVLHAMAGPTLSLRLSARQQTVFHLISAQGVERDLGDEMKRYDLGFTVAGGTEIGRMLFDARYTWGIADVLVEGSGAAVRNRGLLVTAGVRVF